MESVLMGNEILTIDADTRTIEVPSDFLLGVETDNDAERVEFQCPKVVGDNLNLTQYHIYIHYQNAKGEKGKYLCDDIQDSGENITFSWLLSQKAVLYKGQTKFLVCAKKTQEDTIVWNTTLASGNVLEGLDVDEDIVQQNDDVIEQILLKLEQIEASGGTGDINNAKVTFTEAEERANIESQETMSTIFGKIKKWFSDLKTVAFTGSYNDLSNKPDIPEAYTLPQANENQLGGIKAKAKTTEDNEVAIGSDGKLYANSASQEQINTAVDNAINDGRLANMTIEDKSVTANKLANDIISDKTIDGLYIEKVLYNLTNLDSLTRGNFIENIPTPSEDGDKYFTDYIKVEDYSSLTLFKNSTNTPHIRFYNVDKQFVRSQYASGIISLLIQEGEVYIVLEGSESYYGESYRVSYQSEYEYESLNVLSNNEKTYYIQKTTIESTADSSYSELIPVIKGETYTYKGKAGVVIFYDALGNSFGDNKGHENLGINDGESFTIPLDGDITHLKFVCWNNNISYLTGKFFVEKLSNSNLKLIEDNFDNNIIAALRQMLNIGAGSNQFYNVLDFGVTTLADDNTEAFQSAIDTIAEDGGGILWIPKGTYKFDKNSSTSGYNGNAQNNVYLKNNVSIIGESLRGTVLKLIGDTQTGCSLFGSFNGNDNPLSGATYSNFTVDLSEQTMASYTHKAKAFYVHGIKDCVFRDLRLISTPSTSLGIDMLDNVVMDSIYVYQGGRNWTNGGNGGAGIGIGTGLWENENYIIRNCICDDCGHFGIFLEDQGIFSSGKDRNYPKGQIISNNIVRNGRNYGIGVRGGKNVIITGNNIYENVGGVYVDYGAKNVLVSNNLIQGSTDAGFNYGNEDSTINNSGYPCENVAIVSNTFIENAIGIKHTTEPVNRNESNNVFIGNTADNDN